MGQPHRALVLEALQYDYQLTSPFDDGQLRARDLAVAIATDLARDVGLQRARPYTGWRHNEPPPPVWL